MTSRAHAVRDGSARPRTAPARGVLQRACACGGGPGPTGECAECRRKRRHGLQKKLQVNAPGDRWEREADRVAARVLGAPAPTTGAAPLSVTPLLQREGGGGESTVAPPAVDAALAGPAGPLDGPTRSFFEGRFGHDLSQVRVHTDPRAAASAGEMGARAYTVGRDVVFAAGEYRPGTAEGRRLLAHELTHTLQQEGAGPARGLQRRGPPGGGTGGGTATGTPLLHDCSTVPSASNLDSIVAKAVTAADQAVHGLEDVVGHWGAVPRSPLAQAAVMGLRRGFNMEADKSAWSVIGIDPGEISTIDRRDRAAAGTILANFRLIAADAPNYRSAPACTRRVTLGSPCLGCVDETHSRCSRAGATAFVIPPSIGTPSSPIFLCPSYFGLASDDDKAEAFLHEVAHLQSFAPHDWLGSSRYYGCPVAPIDRGGPGLTDPNDFIRVADSYRCFLETLRTYKAAYEDTERQRRRSERAVREVTAPAPAVAPEAGP